MYQILVKNALKYRALFLFGLIALTMLILTFSYKNDENIIRNSQTINSISQKPDLDTLKEFILNKIKSPFINLDYEIKKGDTIEKILKKFKVNNAEIQEVIKKYKKYSNPSQLLAGNRVGVIIKKVRAARSGEIIYQVLKRDGILKEYFDFELTIVSKQK